MPLRELSATDLGRAGGKAAGLGELLRGGFRVPDGFVLTTEAYREAARAAAVDPAEPVTAGERVRALDVPGPIADAAREAYRALGGGPVAVRSSATAEDLPGASFAGQQDTYLDVAGENALLDAIRRCWASLWNERAVAYRRANGIDERDVALAVVVQRMVPAAAAGVLFTADPLTGTRRRAVIEAVTRLGEALVSGHADPDHYTVRASTGEVLERRLVGTQAVLGDDRLRELAREGDRAERHFGTPQDIEFAIDAAGTLWLVQSRPITTLYPLPANAPDPDKDLRVYFSANVAQGMFEPFTPIGIQTFRLISASLAAALGRPVRDRLAGSFVVAEAGMRIYLDVTHVVRHPLGREIAPRILGVMEARTAPLLRQLLDDPRFRESSARLSTFRVMRAIARTGVPWRLLRAMARPDETRESVLAEVDAELRAWRAVSPATAAERVDAFERLFTEMPGRMFPRLVPLVAPGFLSYNLCTRLFRGMATADELRTVLRGLPHNPTTEMDLELWAIARRAREDAASTAVLASRSPADLAAAYRAAALPPVLQRALADFLERYGHRAVAEIDIGVPRWSEDPAHLLGAIANYLRLGDEALAPDAQFARGAREAEQMVRTLIARVHGPKRLLARALLRRVRALGGVREQPKFQIIRVFAIGRALLAPVGAELARAGSVAVAADVFFLTLAEIRRALAGEDLRGTVARRRAEHRREQARRRIPRLMLSDGTDLEATVAPSSTGDLRGSPASPGRVTSTARVIRSPQGSRLEPGEILVAPATDPGWTPLFLTAGGLVMEMGGMMSHGAVVAREYGIPAVVGVAGATERIATGARISVDGSAGTVTVEEKGGGA